MSFFHIKTFLKKKLNTTSLVLLDVWTRINPFILKVSKEITEAKLAKQAKNSVAPDLPLLPMTSLPLTICLPFRSPAARDA